MSLNLLYQPALNASAVPFGFDPLPGPDVSNCERYYSYPSAPVQSDCEIAIGQLPSGPGPTVWYTKPDTLEQRNVLPLSVHHGTCEILFHMSGQSAEDLEFVSIMPSDIRDMARWVVGNCGREGKGGMITKGIKKTMDSMNDGSSRRFPDPALPRDTSFYSLHVWRPLDTGDIDWNPGNNDPDVGGAIDRSLIRAMRAPPAYSPASRELDRRQEYLWAAVGRMEYSEPTTNWWDGPAVDRSSTA